MKFLIVLFLLSLKAYGVEARYHVGVELKPLSTLMHGLKGGRGMGLGVEMNTSVYRHWVVVLSGEMSQEAQDSSHVNASDVDMSTIDRSHSMFRQIGLGIRSYSNRIDDSYYIGGELALAEEEENLQMMDQVFHLRSQSWRPAIEFGHRWIWENGALFRLGIKGIYATGAQSKLVGPPDSKFDLWRGEREEELQKKDRISDFFPVVDIGVGYTF